MMTLLGSRTSCIARIQSFPCFLEPFPLIKLRRKSVLQKPLISRCLWDTLGKLVGPHRFLFFDIHISPYFREAFPAYSIFPQELLCTVIRGQEPHSPKTKSWAGLAQLSLLMWLSLPLCTFLFLSLSLGVMRDFLFSTLSIFSMHVLF